MNKWIKPLGLLAVIILVCSALSRVMSRGETLSEYAAQNPETAYAAPDRTKEPDSSSPDFLTPAPGESALPGQAQVSESPGPEPSVSPSTVFSSEKAPLTEESPYSIHYQDGFFYQPLSESVRDYITGISYPAVESAGSGLLAGAVNVISAEEELSVSYDDLCYMNVLYFDFNGDIQVGELICNQKIAQDLVEIFYELYLNEYQIEKIRLIEEYGGDDTASMTDNNTSCFNYRVVEGTTSLSKHGLGCAIDINPFYNPYVVFSRDGSGESTISPAGSEIYADRTRNFPYKIDENDLCYRLFKAHGFTWGGDWNSSKDYQHFQKAVD